MEVRIYLDSLFVLNTFMNGCILKILDTRFRLSIKMWKLVLASILASCNYILFLLFPKKFYLMHLLEIIISVMGMILIVLPKRKRHMIKQVILYGFGYTFLIAGILRVFTSKLGILTDQTMGLLCYLCVTFFLVIWLIAFIKKKMTKEEEHVCQVVIESMGKQYHLSGLIDTGNSLIEPISRKPVCLLEEEVLAKVTLENELFMRLIPYRSVGCEQGILYGVEIPKMIIYRLNECYQLEHVICAKVGHKLSTKGNYSIIIQPDLLQHT